MDWQSIISQVIDRGADVGQSYFDSKGEGDTYITNTKEDSTGNKLLIAGIIALCVVIGLKFLK